MRTRLPLRAQIVPQRGGKTLTRHVLLVYRDGGITDIGQLPGRKVLVSTLDRGQIASTWLDVLLMRQGLGPAVEEAVDLDIRDRPGYAVPPVLFGQADACIVETRTFDLLCELNPQLRRELRVLSAIADTPDVHPTGYGSGSAEDAARRAMRRHRRRADPGAAADRATRALSRGEPRGSDRTVCRISGRRMASL